MDEASLDDGPTVNFEKATLEIAKEADGPEYNNYGKNGQVNTESNIPMSSSSEPTKDVNIPFRHVDVHTFFSDRNEVVERAIKDCHKDLVKDINETVIGSWLLTEISLWDTEKERLVLLTKTALYSVKYDFISLKILEFSRVPLLEIDTLVTGEIVYPTTSIVPRLNGLAEGVSSMIHSAVRQRWSSLTTCSGFSQFEPRKRNMTGIRLMWNKGQPLTVDKKWNPFARNIPWLTYTSHPLFWHKGSQNDKGKFDVEGFYNSLVPLVSEHCDVGSRPIIVENYCGLGALVHNRTGLGFFKIRGKVSF